MGTIVNSAEETDSISGDGLAAAALDQSHDMIVVLDGDGTIVLTNAAWRAGAQRRGATDATTGCGVNYLEVCERSDASAVAAGIRAVLAGDVPRFEFDYPCHSPVADGWFTLEVLALDEPRHGVVVTHTDVTARVAATRPHQPGRDLDPVTLLATSPAGVTGLSRLLAETQSRGNSLAVVTITFSELAEIEVRHGRRSRDDVVVGAVARIRRLTRADDAIFRASTNQMVVVASVGDARGGEYLGERISEALAAPHLVGADEIESPASVTVTCSDQFSTLDSLMPGGSTAGARRTQADAAIEPSDLGDDDESDDRDASQLPLMVYSLPDGYLLAANDGARSLFGLDVAEPDHLHVRDIADPADLRHTIAAMSALSSGATESYRAQRTLTTDDGPLMLLTSVRRLVVGPGAFAVVLTIPVHPDEAQVTATDDPFSAALVAGTIDRNGAVVHVSAPGSAMESELVGELGVSLRQAAHPDDADLVDSMLESMHRRGSASGAVRVLHAEHGWVVCQCQLFTIRRHADRSAPSGEPDAARDTYGFVLSANVSTSSMIDRIARLERHIRRIGSEVSAADLELVWNPTVDRSVTTALDALAPTARQRDIVERLARGQRVSSIAAELYISRSTVRNHLAQVYRLAGVHSQDELLNALRGH
jgi:DNA-binding CsgD family transcriptional regulator/GGDEF domain-containing protein